MSSRPLTALVAALLLALAPAAAHAADETLLSGYSGPGGGEQALLGSELLPPKQGDGSLRAPAAGGSVTAAPQVAAAPSGAGVDAGAPALAPSAASARKSSSSRAKRRAQAAPSRSAAPKRKADSSSEPATAIPVVTRVAYPTSTGAPSAVDSDLLLLFLGLLGLVLLGVLTARVARPDAPMPLPSRLLP